MPRFPYQGEVFVCLFSPSLGFNEIRNKSWLLGQKWFIQWHPDRIPMNVLSLGTVSSSVYTKILDRALHLLPFPWCMGENWQRCLLEEELISVTGPIYFFPFPLKFIKSHHLFCVGYRACIWRTCIELHPFQKGRGWFTVIHFIVV